MYAHDFSVHKNQYIVYNLIYIHKVIRRRCEHESKSNYGMSGMQTEKLRYYEEQEK